jgi:hypothetical protein
MTVAIGHLFVHDDAVEAFLGGFRQEFFSDRDVFLGGKAKREDDALHVQFGILDLFANLNFLFAREQRDLAPSPSTSAPSASGTRAGTMRVPTRSSA